MTTEKNTEEYGRFCLETNRGISIEIGNLTYTDAKKDAIAGLGKNGHYYDVDYFTWDGEKMDLTK